MLSDFCSAQDSLKIKSDTLVSADSIKEKIHSPLFAGVASAIIPGAGQAYNKKYWKLPIVYAGLATAGYFIYYNANIYYKVHNNLDSRVSGDSTPQPQYLILNQIFSKTTIDLNTFSYDDLLKIEDEYRKYFTISIIVGGVIYMLNILDAVVDAHLYSFDVSDDLAIKISPQLFQSTRFRMAPGFSLSLQIK
jgi:hypothetical protein